MFKLENSNVILPFDHRHCKGLLSDDHVTMLGMHWGDHPQARKTILLVREIQLALKEHKITAYGVTGASGSGRVTPVCSRYSLTPCNLVNIALLFWTATFNL